MKKWLLFVLLLSQISVSQGAFQQGLMVMTSSSHMSTSDDSNNITSTLLLPFTGYSQGFQSISDNSTFYLQQINGSGNLMLDVLSAKTDLFLEKVGSLSEWFVNSSGALNYDIDSETINFTAQDSIYTKELSVPFDIQIQGSELFYIQLADIFFSYSSASVAYFELELEFDSFYASFTFDANSLYYDNLINSSGQVKVIYKDYHAKGVNISQLAEIAESTPPKLLKLLTWRVYANDLYQLSATFDELSFIQMSSDITFTPESSVQSISQYHELALEGEVTIHLVPVSYSSADINWTYSFVSRLKANGTLHPQITNDKATVTLNGTFGSTSFGNATVIVFEYFEYLENLMISAGFNNGTTVIINSPLQIHSFVASFRNTSIPIQAGTALQGSTMEVFIDSSLIFYKSALFHDSGDFIYTFMNNNKSNLTIPNNWNKGTAYLLAWTIEGSYSWHWLNFELSPSKPVVDDVYSIHPARQQIIPIYLENITSQQQVLATSITTYHNNNLRSVDGAHGIIFEPAEFPPGKYMLDVHASAPGLVPSNFTLSISVSEISASYSLSQDRVGVNAAQITLEIKEMSNWTVGVVIHITGSGINQSQYSTSSRSIISIQNNDWVAEESYELQVNIVLDHDLKIYNASVTIDVWNGASPTSKFSKSNLAVFLIGSLLMTSVLLGYYFHKRKLEAETISF